MQLVPLQSNELDERVSAFKKLNPEICKVIPDVLLATMSILFDQYQQIKGYEFVPTRLQDTSLDNVGSNLLFLLTLVICI